MLIKSYLHRTGSRSEVLRVNVVKFDIVVCKVEIWEAGKRVPPAPVHSLRLRLRLNKCAKFWSN